MCRELAEHRDKTERQAAEEAHQAAVQLKEAELKVVVTERACAKQVT